MPTEISRNALAERAWTGAGEGDRARAWKTLRSLVLSMPWLISSTTRKGVRVMFCRLSRYMMVLTLFSPPEWRLLLSVSRSPASRNLTRMWMAYCAYSSPVSCRPTSPTEPRRAKLCENLSLTAATLALSSGSHAVLASASSPCSARPDGAQWPARSENKGSSSAGRGGIVVFFSFLRGFGLGNKRGAGSKWRGGAPAW